MLTGEFKDAIPWEGNYTMKEFRKVPSLKFLYEISQDGILRNVKSKKETVFEPDKKLALFLSLLTKQQNGFVKLLENLQSISICQTIFVKLLEARSGRKQPMDTIGNLYKLNLYRLSP